MVALTKCQVSLPQPPPPSVSITSTLTVISDRGDVTETTPASVHGAQACLCEAHVAREESFRAFLRVVGVEIQERDAGFALDDFLAPLFHLCVVPRL